MVGDDKRYAELPLTTRRFLETLDEQGVVALSNMLRAYRKISVSTEPGKPSALDFLINANPRTLEWLRDARKDEINQLDEAVRLVGSSRTVGRFIKWAVITTAGAFLFATQFGDWIVRTLASIRGGK